MVRVPMSLAAMTCVAMACFVLPAAAQDIPGIENCSAEKAMERRTGCLQANVNYLHALVTKNAVENQRKLAEANAEIASLKAMVSRLQTNVDQLVRAAKAAEEAKKKEREK